MEQVKKFDLASGDTLEIYTNGVVIVKSNGKISERVNPSESFESIAAAGGHAKAKATVDNQVDAILADLGVDPSNEIARQLARDWVVGKGDSGYKSGQELLRRFGKDETAELVRIDDKTVKVKGVIYYKIVDWSPERLQSAQTTMQKIFAVDIQPGADL